MKKWIALPLAALAAVALIAAARATVAGDGGGLHEHIRRWIHGGLEHGDTIDAHLDAMAARLELTAPQRKEVGAAIVAAWPDLEAKVLAAVEAHGKQFELVHSAQLDEEALRVASAKVGESQGAVALAAARLLRDVHHVLTPEQLAKVDHLHDFDPLTAVCDHVRAFGVGLRTWAQHQ